MGQGQEQQDAETRFMYPQRSDYGVLVVSS